MNFYLSIQESVLDDDAVAQHLHALENEARAGATAVFIGRMRGQTATGAAINKMMIECFPAMAQRQLQRIVEEARARWALDNARVVHRHGVVYPNEAIVFVGTAAQHRAEAFAACEFIMDYLKSRAPFWKKEWIKNNNSGEWVAATAADEAAVQRWQSGESVEHGAHVEKQRQPTTAAKR